MSRVVKLEELCLPDQIGKYGIPAVAEEFSEDKVRYLRITDIDDYGNLLENDKKSVSSPEIEKYILKEGDIVFARTGNSTGRTYYHEEKNGELAFAGFLIKFSLDESKVNPKYLKYFTISKPYKQWVDNLSNGSTRGNINAKTFADCPIILPSRAQQDYLVRVLSSLEEKIQINNQINQELEAMAKTLYDYWFVQFDFPDQNGKPYKSSGGKMVYNQELKREIPEGWGVEKLGDVAKFKNGINYEKTSSGSEKVKIINVRNISSSTIFVNQTDLDEISLENDKSTKFIVNEGMILITRSGIPGATRLVSELEAKTVYSGFIIASEVNDLIFKNLIFYYLKNVEEVLKNQSAGTIMKNISQSVLTDMVISLPPQNVLLKFNSIIDNLLEQMKNVQRQNQELTQLRDWLLPMLMNGQVKVE